MRLVRTVCLFLVLIAPASAATPSAMAVASAHPLATEAGLQVMAAGGNAFDAAVAVSAALAVVEPYSSGIGGGGFWLLHRAEDGLDTMVDGRETAPSSAHRDMYLDPAGEVIPGLSMDGPLAAGIPGAPAALAHIADRYGRLPLAQSLAPAIRYAAEGFPVTPHYRDMARFRLAALRASPEAAAIFLHDNDVPPLGHVVRQSDLALTLQALAERGADGFYRGAVARRLVDAVRADGGIWRTQDLAGYRVAERAPLVGTYRGHTVVSAPPPSSGGVALLTMLNILAGYELPSLGAVDRTHLVIEAMRRAYRDRAQYLGDPDFVAVPVARLTHPVYAAGLRAAIHPQRATASESLPGVVADEGGQDTTHFSVIDGEGNYVAATLSINYPFGSGYVAKGTGVLLNDEMDDFSAKPGAANAYGLVGAEANAIEPGKRMLSSMTPTFVRGPEGVAILGTPGGSRIITMVLLGVLDFVEGREPASWVAQPRFHHQYLPDRVFHEPDAFPESLARALTQRGHRLQPLEQRYGNMQAILWRRGSSQVEAASDPRVEGRAEVRPISGASGKAAAVK